MRSSPRGVRERTIRGKSSLFGPQRVATRRHCAACDRRSPRQRSEANAEVVTGTLKRPGNLLTIDLEDWYQLVGDRYAGVDRAYPHKVEHQMERLLGLLARHNCRATFFCLGRTIATAPHIAKLVADGGHEIATHGWSHGYIYDLGLERFGEELRRSIGYLQELTGKPVRGHRAPSFSVRREQLEGFYDTCFDAGLLYDSSVFPYARRRCDWSDAVRYGEIVRQVGDRKLIELPLATIEFAGRRFPVAGGGWWRVLPTAVLDFAVRRLEREGLPFVTYFHPYEFDTQPLSAVSVAGRTLRAFRHELSQNLGRSTMFGKLEKMLARHRFIAVEDYLRDAGHL